MTQITNDELIRKARSVIKSRKIKHGCIVGDVGCALITDKDNVYRGVCVWKELGGDVEPVVHVAEITACGGGVRNVHRCVYPVVQEIADDNRVALVSAVDVHQHVQYFRVLVVPDQV